MGIVDINALSFNYRDNNIFNNLSLNVKEGSFTTIIGNNKAGKTTLIKLLLGFEKSNGIKIFEKPLNNNIRKVRKQIGTIFENPSVFFVFDTVEKEIAFALLNSNLSNEEKANKILEIAKNLEIEHLLYLNPIRISLEEQYLVAFASCLASEPKIIIIDDILSRVNKNVLKILKQINKKGVTIINFTTNAEETLISSHIIFLNQGKVIFSGTKKKLLNHLDVFDTLKIDLPFIIDLSEKLMFYNLIDKKYTNMEKLVDDIWK